jgi:hypothetical protein
MFSGASPDTRQLKIGINNFNSKTGVIPYQNLELLFTGSSDGKYDNSVMAANGLTGNPTPFTIEITKWESTDTLKAIVSGKLSGKLEGFFGSEDLEFTDGVFTDVEVQVSPAK